jgi:hypothetical protein
MKSAVFWGITRRRVVTVYHMTPRNTPEDHIFHQNRGGSLKSIVYHTTPRNTPEDHIFHQNRGGSLKSIVYHTTPRNTPEDHIMQNAVTPLLLVGNEANRS